VRGLKLRDGVFDLFLEGFVDVPFPPLPTGLDFGSNQFYFFDLTFFRKGEDVREIHFSQTFDVDIGVRNLN